MNARLVLTGRKNLPLSITTSHLEIQTGSTLTSWSQPGAIPTHDDQTSDSQRQPTVILSQQGAIPTHNDQTCVVAIAFKRIPFLFC